MTDRSNLAVLGSPIAHSQSPAIHTAAYRALGLPWQYQAIEVVPDALAGFLASRDASWRGLSLTMPLKRDVLPLLDRIDPVAELVGGANTVLLDDSGRSGFNTDVPGAVRALREAGVAQVRFGRILGSGATAASVLAALAELGAQQVFVSARTPANAQPLAVLAERLGVELAIHPWGMMDRSLRAPEVIVSTVPGGASGISFAEPIRARSVLFEVAYDPWPTALVSEWQQAGGTVVHGLELLLWQAVVQVRIFLHGDPGTPLPGEDDVVAAMRAALA